MDVSQRGWDQCQPLKSSSHGHSSDFGFLNVKMTFLGHLVPSLVLISHRQLIIC